MARPNTSSSAEAILTEGTHVRGRISGDGSLRVHGRVEGDVTLRGELHVAQSGRLKSNVDANTVTIEGEVEGSVQATSGSVTVASGARLVGDVHSARFQLEEGGEFAGNLAHDFDLPTTLPDHDGGRGTKSNSQRRR